VQVYVKAEGDQQDGTNPDRERGQGMTKKNRRKKGGPATGQSGKKKKKEKKRIKQSF